MVCRAVPAMSVRTKGYRRRLIPGPDMASQARQLSQKCWAGSVAGVQLRVMPGSARLSSPQVQRIAQKSTQMRSPATYFEAHDHVLSAEPVAVVHADLGVAEPPLLQRTPIQVLGQRPACAGPLRPFDVALNGGRTEIDTVSDLALAEA